MSDPITPPAASGTTSSSGTTANAYLRRPSPKDMAFLCPIVCSCNKTPGIGTDGRLLKQQCVSQKIRAARSGDLMLEYHPEVNYDMTQEPPEPIMDKNVATKAHDWLSGWIAKHWGDPEKNRPQPFEPNKGYIRRPDIVVTKDIFGPPVQPNIKDVIEIKFPGDRIREGQMEDYALIAGKEPCFLTPEDCACDRPGPEGKTIEDAAKDLGPAATLIAWLAWLASRGRGRPPTTAPAW